MNHWPLNALLGVGIALTLTGCGKNGLTLAPVPSGGQTSGKMSPGDKSGNGGDPLAADFVSRGHFVFRSLKAHNELGFSNRDFQRFQLALAETRVEMVDESLLDNEGRHVAAITVPDPLHPGRKIIRVNKSTWLGGSWHRLDRVQWAFHEYLRVLEIKDDNYAVSTRLSVSEQDFTRTLNPMKLECESGPVWGKCPY